MGGAGSDVGAAQRKAVGADGASGPRARWEGRDGRVSPAQGEGVGETEATCEVLTKTGTPATPARRGRLR